VGVVPGPRRYVWHAGCTARTVIDSLEAVGFAIRSQIVWPSRALCWARRLPWQHEPCLYAVRTGCDRSLAGRARPGDAVEHIPRGDADAATVHGTQSRSSACAAPCSTTAPRATRSTTRFLGSGTTLVAASLAERRCHAIDVDPRYVDVAVQRWQRVTGEAAFCR
jgi:hypothetical protein